MKYFMVIVTLMFLSGCTLTNLYKSIKVKGFINKKSQYIVSA